MMPKIFPSPRLHFQRGHWFHNFIVGLDKLDLLPGPVALIFALSLPGLASLSWAGHQLFAFALPASALLIEAASLLASRRPGRSPGPFAGPLALFAVGHGTALLAASVLPGALAPAGLWLGQAGLLGAFLYGYWVEPWKVGLRWEEVELITPGKLATEVARTSVCSMLATEVARTTGQSAEEDSRSRARKGAPTTFTALVVSDLHLDRRGPREAQVLAHARAVKPDLILIPGDLTQLSTVDDPLCAADAVSFLKDLRALAPVFLSLGTPEVDERDWVRSLTDAAGVTLLDNACVDFPTADSAGRDPAFTLVGVTAAGPLGPHRDTLRALLAERTATPSANLPVVLLYHTPDIIETAAAQGVALQLSGHTHGGQIRLPLIGPLITASRYGRRFASGRFQVGWHGLPGLDLKTGSRAGCPCHSTTLLVSRGVGLEGAGAPRLRFLCPPEVIAVRLRVGLPQGVMFRNLFS